jgi:hypothetical protein
MPNYTHVQFISWELYTGPNRGPKATSGPAWSRDKPGISYTGLGSADDSRLEIKDQIADIEERLQFTYKAMTTAHDWVGAAPPSTLRVFMAPEFLYRGRGGAYIHDLINGWQKEAPREFDISAEYKGFWPGLFGYLQTYAREPQFEHWLLVFGTAISASFPATNVQGKWVWDTDKKGEIYNTALIQLGGQGHTDANYASRKHYISGIDFINTYLGAKPFTSGDVVPLDRAELEPNETNREGSAIFQINGVNDKDGKPIIFGLEVCLDHGASTGSNDQRNDWGRIRTADQWVKIQLVPSGGMSLRRDSIRLLPAAGPTPHSYAFNCDGLTTMTLGPDNWDWGTHTQIWNGANGAEVLAANKLIEASTARYWAQGDGLHKVDDDLNWAGRGRTIHAANLWDFGAGYVRVTQEMPL